MPYTRIVGQEDLKLALQMSYINPRIGGVLIEGERGTAKSTIVRAFSLLTTRGLPVTLPINATEDRVIGSWRLDQLLKGRKSWQPGLLEQAHKGILYVDEVNLLDDHIVNLLLDASSTGILVIERDNEDKTVPVTFRLIGTMNPEEGQLRPQLLDRFGLCVQVTAESEAVKRQEILRAILDFDRRPREMIAEEKEACQLELKRINEAKSKLENNQVAFSAMMAKYCVEIARAYHAEGHRGDHVLALAAQACAALSGARRTTTEHLRRVAPMALQHRLIDAETRERLWWKEDILKSILDAEPKQPA